MHDVLLPFRRPRTQLLVPRRYRASWVSSSIQTLRRYGHYDRYRSLLAPASRDTLEELSASAWVPAEQVMHHYSACDRLELAGPELELLGAVTTRLAIGNTLHVALRLATGAGVVSPWTILSQGQRLMDMICEGSGVEVVRLGPKEAVVDLAAFPLARYGYNRAAMRGILLAGVEPFCRRAYVSVAPAARYADDIRFRVSWA